MIHFYKKSLNWSPRAAGYPLGNALGITRRALLSRNSRSPESRSIVINWGMSQTQPWEVLWYNNPDSVHTSANKISMMNVFKSYNIPRLEVVNRNEVDPDTILVARHLLSSHSGRGIEIAPASSISTAPLYTKLELFDIEQRLFIVGSTIVDIVEKKKMGREKREKYGIAEVNEHIKSFPNGWIYARNNINQTPEELKVAAIDAMSAIGLDFGCVDVAWNNDRGVVIEVNSAPGFKNTETIGRFSEALRSYVSNIE